MNHSYIEAFDRQTHSNCSTFNNITILRFVESDNRRYLKTTNTKMRYNLEKTHAKI